MLIQYPIAHNDSSKDRLLQGSHAPCNEHRSVIRKAFFFWDVIPSASKNFFSAKFNLVKKIPYTQITLFSEFFLGVVKFTVDCF